MPYRLKDKSSVEREVHRIADEQIARALEEIEDPDLNLHDTVHQVRKRCKKIRALLRLARPALGKVYSRENERYRDAARILSGLRDTEAVLETYDELMDRYDGQVDRPAMGRIRKHLTERQTAYVEGLGDARELLREFESAIVEGRKALDSWKLEAGGFDAVAGGAAKTYGRARDAMDGAYEEGSPEAFHEWRKRVKYHWYHMRLLREIWNPVMRARRDEVDRLGSLLGDHHNLFVLRARIRADSDAVANDETIEAFTALMERNMDRLEKNARPLGRRILAEKPGRLVSRFGVYWDAWPE